MQSFLEKIAAEVRPRAAEGTPAQYIPALARVDPTKFAIALMTAEGEEFVTGDADTPFSVQSISKLFTLALAMEWVGAPLWERVKREPSGMRFNSIIQLETENGVPRNPFINAGAIVVTDALMHNRPTIEVGFRNQMRLLARDETICYDEEVHRSEMLTGDMNRAAAFLLKAKGNLTEDAILVTNAYFHFCSLAMSARQLARAALFLIKPQHGDAACARGLHAQRLRAIMRTCGLYDQSGEFAYHVGMPAKSGVGGGILAVNPTMGYAVCAWSPPLDRYGNSIAATEALALLAAKTGV
ncbi:glutaminase A [Pikeienuella piscinae]|uniref:Glutaminase n=1 Tax=Pikeienuella piscinae TaxID=2748098 RepID=A0A7L5BUE5_9RHOB|nr:glutaminase A [Pikeienuella piscinae]QIE55232.1 glutaminase A [Pikeienuella piscinae]